MLSARASSGDPPIRVPPLPCGRIGLVRTCLMLCPAASGRGGAWCGQSLVVGSLSILVAREARLGWVPSHSRLPRRLDLGFKLDRTERPLGHSHRVELGRVWGWGHFGRCPCHMTQLWPLLVRRGPRLFRGHLVRCRPPEFRLREGAPGRREYQRGGLPNLDAEDARVQALELFDVDVLASTSRSAENSRTVQNSR